MNGTASPVQKDRAFRFETDQIRRIPTVIRVVSDIERSDALRVGFRGELTKNQDIDETVVETPLQ